VPTPDAEDGPGRCRLVRMVLGCVVLSLGCLAWGPVVIGRAEGWKACAFNDQSIGCRDTHSPDGTVRIVWQECKAMTYRMVSGDD